MKMPTLTSSKTEILIKETNTPLCILINRTPELTSLICDMVTLYNRFMDNIPPDFNKVITNKNRNKPVLNLLYNTIYIRPNNIDILKVFYIKNYDFSYEEFKDIRGVMFGLIKSYNYYTHNIPFNYDIKVEVNCTDDNCEEKYTWCLYRGGESFGSNWGDKGPFDTEELAREKGEEYLDNNPIL